RVRVPEDALWGDAREGLVDLRDAVAGIPARREWATEAARRMRAWREEVSPRLLSDERPISMARLCHELNAVMPEDGILVADGGFAAHWTGLLYDTKAAGRHYIADRGLASIGYGLPGGMGAALAAR